VTPQLAFLDADTPALPPPRRYGEVLTAVRNGKGVIDVDTVKGCTAGMTARPNGGCYGECYAAKTAARYGIDFTVSVKRKILEREHLGTLITLLQTFPETWYRIGVAGDPCHDWRHTLVVVRALRHAGKVPVIITKHWRVLTDAQIEEFGQLSAVFNTSLSGLDTDAELRHRLTQLERLRAAGVESVCRVVTCEYGVSEWAQRAQRVQNHLLTLVPVIDNPLRVSKSNPRVASGDIIVTERADAIGGGNTVSLHGQNVYLGTCAACPDQCGVSPAVLNCAGGKFISQGTLKLEGERG